MLVKLEVVSNLYLQSSAPRVGADSWSTFDVPRCNKNGVSKSRTGTEN